MTYWVKTIEYLKQKRGSTSIFFALSLTAILVVVGAAFDYSAAGNSKYKAQMVADSVALAAARDANADGKKRYWKDNKNIEKYNYDENLLMRDTNVQVNYDDDNDQVIVTISGKTPTTIMSIIGVGSLDWSVTSTVAYPQTASRPVSLFVVMDNSGSMGDPDPSGGTKLSNAKSALNGLMSQLETIPNDDPKIIRTAMTAFSGGFDNSSFDWFQSGWYNYWRIKTGAEIGSGIISSNNVSPFWGTLSENQVNRLVADGWTYPVGSLEQALRWMEAEKAIHKNMNGDEDPLLVVLLMSDGANLIGEYGDDNLRDDQENLGLGYNYCSEWSTREYEVTRTVWDWVDGSSGRGRGADRTRDRGRGGNGGHWELVEVTETVTETTCATWTSIDDEMQTACTALKDAGVEIYAVGYDVGEDQYDRATSNLKSCASSEDHYLYSENGDALQGIFDGIGQRVTAAVVRITS